MNVYAAVRHTMSLNNFTPYPQVSDILYNSSAPVKPAFRPPAALIISLSRSR
jgi:hypothetical protein